MLMGGPSPAMTNCLIKTILETPEDAISCYLRRRWTVALSGTLAVVLRLSRGAELSVTVKDAAQQS